jgi:hypothetical protein
MPEQQLELVATAIAEDKEMTGKGTGIQYIDHQRGEPVDLFGA